MEDTLWEIYEWDEKWGHLQQRKQALRQMFMSAPEGKIQNEEAIALLEASQKEEELNDIQDYYQLHSTPSDKPAVAQPGGAGPAPKHKRPVRRDTYAQCVKAGLSHCAKYFGLTSQQFGDNLVNDYANHDPNDHTYEFFR